MTTPDFEQAIQTHLEAGHSRIIIDCQRMGFLSSLGIGALVALQTRLRRKGGDVKLAAIQGPVMQVLKIVRLDRVFDIHGDAEFARKAFEAERKTS
jgi:anti-sigma B factor antagonist